MLAFFVFCKFLIQIRYLESEILKYESLLQNKSTPCVLGKNLLFLLCSFKVTIFLAQIGSYTKIQKGLIDLRLTDTERSEKVRYRTGVDVLARSSKYGRRRIFFLKIKLVLRIEW